MSVIAAITLCLLGPIAQDPTPAAVSPREAIAALPDDQKHDIVRILERRILLDPDPVIQTVVSMARDFDTYPLASPRVFHDPQKWTKGVAPRRVVVRAGTAQHRRVRQSNPVVPFLTDLHMAVWYDWGSAEVVRRAKRLTDDELFENLLNGYPPGADAAVAHVLEILDNDPRQRPMGAYLDHLYADLRARVYEDITLYEAWYSGEILDVPDVDAIAFAVQILNTKAYRSPIPQGPGRIQLYQQIRNHTLTQRRYRSLREAAAGGFVRAEPILDPTYQPLVPRFHYLWSAEEEDPAPVAAWLGTLPDRAAFVAKTDARYAANSDAYERRETRQSGVAAMAEKVRSMAIAELSRPR